MSKVVSLPSKSVPGAQERRAEERVEAIRKLIQTLEPHEQEQLARELSAALSPTPKAGDVLGNIVKFIGKQREWTAVEIKQQIDELGLEASSKEVYNAIGYLAKKGHIKRVGYGRYLVNGMLIATSDDFGGATARHEDPYRTDTSNE